MFNNEYLSHEKTKSGVFIMVTDRKKGETKIIQSQYLVAADGVKSKVRGDLGIKLNGQQGKNVIY